MAQSPRRPLRYFAGAVAIVILWILLALVLLQRESFGSTGPLSPYHPGLRSALPGGPEPRQVLRSCFPRQSRRATYKVVGGPVDGRDLYACYQFDPDGTLTAAKVVEADGLPVQDVRIIKRGGAWPWIGAVNSGGDVLGGVLFIGSLLLLTGAVYRRALPAPGDGPRWRRAPLRRIALVTLGIAAAFPAMLLEWRVDPPGLAWATLPPVAFVYGIVAGRRWLVPAPPPAPAPPAPAPSAAPAAVIGGLTSRELDVLRHLAMGLSNAEIAEALFVSEATVKSHVARLLTKLGVSNRVQAALFAHQHGLADDRA
jgi:DNA-binding CsgD family transcriptional regulator